MKILYVIYLAVILTNGVVKCFTSEETYTDIFNYSDPNLIEPPHDPVIGDYSLKPEKGFPKEPIPTAETVDCDKTKYIHPDSGLDIPDIIKKYGYEFELHKVRTEDGYILGVFRISGSPISPPRQGKIPVYLNHGLMGNALSWLFLYGDNCLAFKLANAGYDVFLGNARGTQYSEGHDNLTTSDDEYWNFSFHELGYYDVPAVIDYILNVTQQKDIYYIGHSLGTAQYMVAMSERPEYGNKIRVGFLLCPAAFVHSIRSPPLNVFLHLVLPTYDAWKLFFGNSLNQKQLADSLSACATGPLGCGTCDHLAFYLNGYNSGQNNVSLAGYFNRRYYDTTSTKVFAHLSQSAQFKTFNQFNYDVSKNILKYGTESPPAYKLGLINSPTVIYWGYSDSVTTPEDVKQTAQMFSPGVVKENNRVVIKSFNHLDFLIANDVKKYVYNRIQYIMDKALYINETKNNKTL